MDSIREVVIAIIGGVATNQLKNSLALPPSPVVIVQPSPNSMFNITGITSSVIPQAVFYTIRRPNSLISVINEGTGAIAYGIRRILHLQRRSNTAPTPVEGHPVDIPSAEILGEGTLSSRITRSLEFLREFTEDAPLTSNAVRESFLVGFIFMSIVYGAQYFTTQQNRHSSLQRMHLNDKSGLPSFTGSSLSIDREGRIIVIVTPLPFAMGCNLAIIAVLWTIWRYRVSRSGMVRLVINPVI